MMDVTGAPKLVSSPQHEALEITFSLKIPQPAPAQAAAPVLPVPAPVHVHIADPSTGTAPPAAGPEKIPGPTRLETLIATRPQHPVETDDDDDDDAPMLSSKRPVLRGVHKGRKKGYKLAMQMMAESDRRASMMQPTPQDPGPLLKRRR